MQNNVVDLRYLKLLILLDQNQKFEKSKVYNNMLQKYKDLNILVREKKTSVPLLWKIIKKKIFCNWWISPRWAILPLNYQNLEKYSILASLTVKIHFALSQEFVQSVADFSQDWRVSQTRRLPSVVLRNLPRLCLCAPAACSDEENPV